MNMKKFLSTRSSSPVQEKSKDCQSKAATCVNKVLDYLVPPDLGKGDSPSKSAPSRSIEKKNC